MTNIRPKLLKDIIGQTEAKKVCHIIIQSSISRKVPIPHTIFSGCAGSGKTTFALAMANERNVPIKIANAGSVSNIECILQAVSDLRLNEIFFIDEIHRLPIKVCEWLYPVMEDFRYEVTNRYGQLRSEPIRPFTMIGATTLLGKIPKPLKDRFKSPIEFLPYSMVELKEIVLRTAEAYDFNDFSDRITTAIAQTCRGNPRRIISRTEWIRDYMIASDVVDMGIDEIWKAIEMQGIDKNGLEPVDQRYIQILKDDSDGVVSLNGLASKLDVDTETVQNTIEPYLMQIGLIDINKKGRFLIMDEYKKLGYK